MLSEGEIISLILTIIRRIFRSLEISSRSLAGLKSGGRRWLERSPFRERAYRTLAAAAVGAAVDVLRMRKTRKSGADWQEGTMKLKWRKRITD